MASGDTLAVFVPQSNEPPSASAALLDTRNQHPVLDFSASVNDVGVFSNVMPRNYSGGSTIVYLSFAMSSAETGDVDWGAAWERIGDGLQDLDSDGFAACQTVANTTVSPSSGCVITASVGFESGSMMDSTAAGEGYRLKVIRNGVADTAAGDAELRFLEVKEA